MWMRSIVTAAAVVAAVPAIGAELRPEEAKHFIAGKHFSYTCFEGSTGAGRINADGSVAGTIQIRGSGPVHFVNLPVGTIRVAQDSICASVKGMLFQPCFSVSQTDARSFRGALSGLGFAYCDFTRRNPRLDITATPQQPQQPQQQSTPAPQQPPASGDMLRASVTE
jgi:hypothetical protein